MDNKFKSLPEDVASALEALSEALSKSGMPFFCLIPIPHSPFYIRQFNELCKTLRAVDKAFIEQLILTQYTYIAQIKYKPELIDSLKQMKDIDPHFRDNLRKKFQEEGMAIDYINDLIDECNVKEVIDYTFRERLEKKRFSELKHN